MTLETRDRSTTHAHHHAGAFRLKHALAGLELSVVAIRLFHLAVAPGALELFALFLAYTACVYFGAALSDGRERWVAVEFLLSLGFLGFAVLGLRYAPEWLAAGYVLHGAWDFVHHPRSGFTRVLHWFPPVCAVFDFVVAGWILYAY